MAVYGTWLLKSVVIGLRCHVPFNLVFALQAIGEQIGVIPVKSNPLHAFVRESFQKVEAQVTIPRYVADCDRIAALE